jgi:putative colanic acid biosynthesis acetyltransferase WcaF
MIRQLIDLELFDNKGFHRGRPRWIEALWITLSALLVESWLPGSWHRVLLLRLFGAVVGRRVVIKPHVRVKFPWRLRIGNDSWIGEGAWIDNLDSVDIGSDCCISQGAYLCTGSHDWAKPGFDLIVRPIRIGNGAWIAAKAVIAPGVTIGEGAVLTLGSVAVADLEPWTIYRGCPAAPVRKRVIS